MDRRIFGDIDGEPIHEVTLRSEAGAEARVIGWGAVLRDLVVPVGGRGQRVVLGLDTLADYIHHSPYFGGIAGRYGNRIARGRFRLDGRSHQLSVNDGRNSLHGGVRGLMGQPWQIAAAGPSWVALAVVSPDGEDGYPGTLSVTCLYRLIGSTLRVELTATSDAATPVNLCQHSYFNLDGGPSVLDHILQLDADFYTPVDEELIPTGEVRAVAGTVYDFRRARPLRLEEPGAGRPCRYDNNFVLRRERLEPAGAGAAPLAHTGTLASTRNGLSLEVWTTEPGLQVYDGWMTDVPVPGLGGARYGAYAGICLEPQRFPDGPNRAHFPDPILRPGELYRQVTEYRFVAAP